jgi:dihydroorotase
MEKGDILTHYLTAKPGRVFDASGNAIPEFKDAVKRGIVLDVSNAKTNATFELTRKSLEQGIMPTTLSTDITEHNRNVRAVLSLIVTMSKFLAFGFSLDDVIAMTTINPARVLGEEHRRGSLKVGMPADVSIMKLDEGDFTFYDTEGEENPLKGKQLLVPEMVLKTGEEIKSYSRYK